MGSALHFTVAPVSALKEPQAPKAKMANSWRKKQRQLVPDVANSQTTAQMLHA